MDIADGLQGVGFAEAVADGFEKGERVVVGFDGGVHLILPQTIITPLKRNIRLGLSRRTFACFIRYFNQFSPKFPAPVGFGFM